MESKENITSLCPSIISLHNNLNSRLISSEDLPLAQSICAELSQIHSIRKYILSVSKIIGYTNRFIIYSGTNYEIRIHIFLPGAQESYMHNHQYHFISCCLTGAYMHKIYIQSDIGTPSFLNALAQPFQAGQCLFVAGWLYHTVAPFGNEQLVTVTFKDKRKVNEESLIVNDNNTTIVPEVDEKSIDEMADVFDQAIKKYREKFVCLRIENCPGQE